MLHVIILGIVQGITEFLPISSSAHLAILPKILQWKDSNIGFSFDVALQIGTLLAVIIYFYKDCWNMLIGFILFLRGTRTPNGWMAIWVVVSTIPIVICGYIYNHYYPDSTNNLKVLGATSIIFGFLMWISDKYLSSQRKLKDMTFKDALLIGISQVFALIPGSSRSGTSMTMARFLSIDRDESARYSMLISIPTILGSIVLIIVKAKKTGESIFSSTLFNYSTLLGVAVSFIVAIISVDFLMSWLKRSNFNIFVIYRVLLGVFLIVLSYLYSFL